MKMDATTNSGETALDMWSKRLTRWLTRLIYGISRHWLLLVNVLFGLFYLVLPALAPALMLAGQEKIANVLYTIFRPLCHQLPERSFFIGGPQAVYSLDQLTQLLGVDGVPMRFVGDASIGYKIAICQRDVAIYLAWVLTGVAFYWLRERLRPLSLKQFALFCLPMAVDGFGQLFGLWESTWISRVATGGLFGVATVLLVYPYLQRGMAEVQTATKQENLVRDE
jgi:uncharacterized membrane protein